MLIKQHQKYHHLAAGDLTRAGGSDRAAMAAGCEPGGLHYRCPNATGSKPSGLDLSLFSLVRSVGLTVVFMSQHGLEFMDVGAAVLEGGDVTVAMAFLFGRGDGEERAMGVHGVDGASAKTTPRLCSGS